VKFMIWEWLNETEEDAVAIYAPSVAAACKRWAEKYYEWGGSNQFELAVFVRSEDGSVVRCTVSVEYVREFSVAVGAAASAEEYEQGGGQ